MIPITVTIIAFNEEEKILQALESVRWAQDIVVVDSGSVDKTRKIVENFGARFVSRPWEGYGQQKNFAQSQAKYDWVLNIDADEVVPEDLAQEIQATVAAVESGKRKECVFKMPRRNHYLGRWIRYGGWYPNHLARLANRKFARWTEPNVHEELRPIKDDGGSVGYLSASLNHFGFDTIEDQILTNLRFSRLGSQDLAARGQRSPNLFLLVFKPLGKFLETYVLKRGFLDGMRGFLISVNAAHSIFLKYSYFFEIQWKGETDLAPPHHRQQSQT